MKLSTKTRYATRALAELAVAWPDGVMATREIAEKQNISFKYLEQIMAPLRNAGIVESHQGKGGGFSLARPPEDITLEEVYRAFEGSPAPVQCLEEGGTCSLQRVCPSRETWEEIRERILDVLRNTTLRDLEERLRERTGSSPPMYHI